MQQAVVKRPVVKNTETHPNTDTKNKKLKIKN